MLQADVKFRCKKYTVTIKKLPADCVPIVLNFFEYQENRPEWKFERFRHGEEVYPGIFCERIDQYFGIADFECRGYKT